MELHISSKDANLAAGHTRSRFGVDLLWNQLAGSNAAPANGYEILISSWSVPFTWYGIHDNNNTIVMEINSVNYAIVIPNGTYNASDLAAYLQTTINSIAASESQVFTVTFDDATAKFTFTKTSGTGTWNFVTGPVAVAATEASPATAGDYTFSAYRALGLFAPSTGSAISPPAANSVAYSSERVVNMMPIDRLHLEMNWPEVRSYDTRTHGHNESMAQMSPTGSWGSFIQYGGEHTTVFRCHELPTQLQVALVDGEGTDVDLNGHDWYFTLSVYGLEGMTPMKNMSENKHDTRHDTARMNMRSTVHALPMNPHHDAPNRQWQGHAPATSVQQGTHANLNPKRNNNPFLMPL